MDELKTLIDENVIEKATTKLEACIVLALKEYGLLQFSEMYQKLNVATVRDVIPSVVRNIISNS